MDRDNRWDRIKVAYDALVDVAFFFVYSLQLHHFCNLFFMLLHIYLANWH